MHQERENLDIIFRKRTPEGVLHKLRNMDKVYDLKKPVMPYEMTSSEEYDRYGYANLTGISQDEIRLRYDAMCEDNKETQYSVFSMLYRYSEKVLEYVNHEPFCRMNQVLNWNSIASRIGQDILVTAWLAHRDVLDERFEEGKHECFDWPYCIRVKDWKLHSMIEQGVAENHFHLWGSTQSFSLSWAALMNHPYRIVKTICDMERFRRNLVTGSMDPDGDNEKRWIDRLRCAAFIRGLLFEKCANGKSSSEIQKEFTRYDIREESRMKQISDKIELLRFCYGERVQQPHRDKCLDYTMSRVLYSPNLDSSNRLLSGERALLYHCFRKIYINEFTEYEKSIFYIYLLIKANFRGEMIQINRRNGFQNFADYQSRKGQFYEGLPEYESEALRLAVSATIKENHIETLEARIMPGITWKDMAEKLRGLDEGIGFVSKEDMEKVSYITHFAKTPFRQKELEKQRFLLYPRNYKVREKIERQAKALYEFRIRCHQGGKRICGIDACSNEVGCRPETFATEFRFLRGCRQPLERKWYLPDEPPMRDLGVTYHAGEDFLDICDGLRAVDEALEFLEMRNGDRIGHGLVLGLDPEEYYRDRYYNMYLRKQDLLDNCIWLMYRTLEWDIPLDSSSRKSLEHTAEKLLHEIYKESLGKQSGVTLEDYYDSWRLRADHPRLYASGEYQKTKYVGTNPYRLYLEGSAPKNVRENPEAGKLYYLYHFDVEVKKKGLEVEPIAIKQWYIELMERMQAVLRRRIAQMGISIECNPSSNYLIGYFNRYDQHPIFTFNNYRLGGGSEESQIHVSINTDDLGVFDTSMSYEYALLYAAVCRKRYSEGCYNDAAVYDYLDYIRESGLKMHFK